jgi:hypothetical protein
MGLGPSGGGFRDDRQPAGSAALLYGAPLASCGHALRASGAGRSLDSDCLGAENRAAIVAIGNQQ